MPKRASQSETATVRLARYLCERREAIISDWLELVRADPKLPTDSMSTLETKDHVPQLFDNLAETLRLYPSSSVDELSQKNGATHGDTRWKEGYSLPEVLREIKHLRKVLVRHLHAFENQNPDFTDDPRLFAASTLHAFLDNMALDASEEFLDLQNG